MQLKGIYAPIVTPFDNDENINFPVYERLIAFLLENGIAGFVPGGTTGEVYALSDVERIEIFKFVKAQVAGRALLMAGVNAGSTREVIRFSQAAEEMGYDALMVAVPPYSRPSQRELLWHFRKVAESVGIPIVLYNFPWRAGSEVGYEVLDGLTEYQHVIGIKEASGEMSRVYEMRLRYGDRYQIICGSDDQALDYFLWGSTAWIGGAASCLPRQHVDVLEAALANDFVTARKRMEKIMPFIRYIESGSYTQKVKYACELQGIPVGRPRGPLLLLDEPDEAELEDVLAMVIGDPFND
ncbi:MAG: 4-hydroxy-tetrahydrodipicolinate synthase [Anaerolineales bacterium]